MAVLGRSRSGPPLIKSWIRPCCSPFYHSFHSTQLSYHHLHSGPALHFVIFAPNLRWMMQFQTEQHWWILVENKHCHNGLSINFLWIKLFCHSTLLSVLPWVWNRCCSHQVLITLRHQPICSTALKSLIRWPDRGICLG